MSCILGIDTSSTELSVALVAHGQPVLSLTRYIRNSHAEHITAAVHYLLESSGVSAAEITHAAISVGPGSFTGLRIGISFVKGLLFGRSVPVLPVSSLEALGYAFMRNRGDGTVLAAMDARQARIFSAAFRKNGAEWHRLSDDLCLSAEAFAAQVGSYDTAVADSMGFDKGNSFESLTFAGELHNAHNHDLPRGLACALIAQSRIDTSTEWTTTTELLPRYLQESYAERTTGKQVAEE